MVRVSWVSVLVIVIRALGTPAPAGSTTVPASALFWLAGTVLRVVLVCGMQSVFAGFEADCCDQTATATLTIAANVAATLFETRSRNARKPTGQSFVKIVPSARR